MKNRQSNELVSSLRQNIHLSILIRALTEDSPDIVKLTICKIKHIEYHIDYIISYIFKKNRFELLDFLHQRKLIHQSHILRRLSYVKKFTDYVYQTKNKDLVSIVFPYNHLDEQIIAQDFITACYSQDIITMKLTSVICDMSKYSNMVAKTVCDLIEQNVHKIYEIVQICLLEKMNIHLFDDAMICLAAKNNFHVFRLLAEFGADINAQNGKPFENAIFMGNTEVVHYCQKHNAYMNTTVQFIGNFYNVNQSDDMEICT